MRGLRARRLASVLREEKQVEEAVLQIQSATRGMFARKHAAQLRQEQSEVQAAVQIQVRQE